MVEQFHRHRGESQVDEQLGYHARFAQQDHPAESAHGFADPERDQADHEQERRGPSLRHFGDDPRDGERQSQGQQGRENRHQGRAHEDVPVERFGEERPILGEARRECARAGALAQGNDQKFHVRQQNQCEEPQQGRREQPRQHPGRPPACGARFSHRPAPQRASLQRENRSPARGRN